MKTKTFQDIFEKARKSPTYKAARLSIQFWEIVLKTLKERNMTVGQLAKKLKIPVAILNHNMDSEYGFMMIINMAQIMAVLDIDLKLVEDTRKKPKKSS